jgi:hypothetical protein
MSDCTAIYPAKPIECLRDAGHDGDHAGQDDAGFQVYWSKPNADMVPAARLDDATLEIARLKAQVSNAVANLEEAQILFASIRQADALAPWACESEPGEDSFDEQVREMLRDLEKITGFAAHQRAALTPKEP